MYSVGYVDGMESLVLMDDANGCLAKTVTSRVAGSQDFRRLFPSFSRAIPLRLPKTNTRLRHPFVFEYRLFFFFFFLFFFFPFNGTTWVAYFWAFSVLITVPVHFTAFFCPDRVFGRYALPLLSTAAKLILVIFQNSK